MPFEPYNRTVYLGEPIESLTVKQGDQFYLGFDLYDDQGIEWADNYLVDLFLYMSNRDDYDGSSYFGHFSGTTSSGSVSILITNSGTATPGNYKGELVISSGSGATDQEITIGQFEFIINGD